MEDYIVPYVVFVKLNERSLITDVNSDAFLRDAAGWTEIDRGDGDKYHHAQVRYFSMPIADERGIWRYRAYRLADAPADREHICTFERDGTEWVIVERTQAEMDADYDPPIPQPSEAERIKAIEDQLAAYEAAYAQGVSEA